MRRHLLSLSVEGAKTAEGFDEIFLWSDGKDSSFKTVGPKLTGLGSVPPLNADMVRIALAVFASDRSVPRKGQGSNWNSRNFQVTVPVSKPDAWSERTDQLSNLVNFLTGDKWTFEFVGDAPLDVAVPANDAGNHRVVLLSGGADSATGALVSRQGLGKDEQHTLVSHFSATSISPYQKDIAARIDKLIPNGTQAHIQVQLNRGKFKVNGGEFKNETSSRSRSLLFLSLGLAVAAQGKVPLWIPENGFASLNPPLGPERRGSLTTHTTHPKFLHDLSLLLSDVGAHGEIINPFLHQTKGEMFQQVASILGADRAAEYLSATNSCAHTHARFASAPQGSSCGECFGCIVRRASFVAAGIEDKTAYLSEHHPSKTYDAFVKTTSSRVAIQDFAMAGVDGAQVMAMNLPSDYDPVDALDLCTRAVGELREFFA